MHHAQLFKTIKKGNNRTIWALFRSQWMTTVRMLAPQTLFVSVDVVFSWDSPALAFELRCSQSPRGRVFSPGLLLWPLACTFIHRGVIWNFYPPLCLKGEAIPHEHTEWWVDVIFPSGPRQKEMCVSSDWNCASAHRSWQSLCRKRGLQSANTLISMQMTAVRNIPHLFSVSPVSPASFSEQYWTMCAMTGQKVKWGPS